MLLSLPAWAGAECAHAAAGASSACKTPFLFITLGFGYWLLRLAESETVKLLKVVGRLVSWILLIGSFLGLLCSAMGPCRKSSGAMMCAKPAGAHCPMSGAPATSTTTAPAQ
jgi:hypothetical protein